MSESCGNDIFLDFRKAKNHRFIGQAYGLADSSGTSGAADPMDVAFAILGKVVIDHMSNAFDVNTPGCNIGGHQKGQAPVFEVLEECASV